MAAELAETAESGCARPLSPVNFGESKLELDPLNDAFEIFLMPVAPVRDPSPG